MQRWKIYGEPRQGWRRIGSVISRLMEIGAMPVKRWITFPRTQCLNTYTYTCMCNDLFVCWTINLEHKCFATVCAFILIFVFPFFFNNSCLFSLILILYLTISTASASSSRGAVFCSVQTLTEQWTVNRSKRERKKSYGESWVRRISWETVATLYRLARRS